MYIDCDQFCDVPQILFGVEASCAFVLVHAMLSFAINCFKCVCVCRCLHVCVYVRVQCVGMFTCVHGCLQYVGGRIKYECVVSELVFAWIDICMHVQGDVSVCVCV